MALTGPSSARPVDEEKPAPAAVIDLRDLFTTLRRQGRWVFWSTLICTLIGTTVAYVLPVRYTATAQILLDVHGLQVMQGDLTDLTAMHRAIDGCARIYFGMSVSSDYLTATVNTAAVARHHGVEAFINMSQMTVTQMSITESTDSPQHKLHWLAEQALSWSGLPVVTMRPTVFLEGFFRLFAAPGVRDADELALPMGGGKLN